MSYFSTDLGLLIIRVAVGMLFAKHGIDKFMGGSEVWVWTGQQLSHFGITFMPTLFGLVAACVECFGGAALMLGVYPRFAAGLIACVMVVALRMHFAKGDAFAAYSHPLVLLAILVGLVIAGGGAYALTK